MKIVWVCKEHTPCGLPPEHPGWPAETDVVIRADTAENVLELCAVHKPDIVIFGVSPHDGGTLDSAACIKRDFPDVQVCVVLDADNAVLMKRAEASGADIIAPIGISSGDLAHLLRYSQKHYRVFPASDS